MVVLIGVIVSVMCVFLLRMYTLAAVSPDERAVADADSMTYQTTVEGARGCILDRNGNVLVSNRATYNIVIINYVLANTGAPNENILKLLQMCQQLGIECQSHFPVTKTKPYEYDMQSLNTTWQNYFRMFLNNRDYDLDISASTLMRNLREAYRIPNDWDADDVYNVIAVRYELELRSVDNTGLENYMLAKDVDAESWRRSPSSAFRASSSSPARSASIKPPTPRICSAPSARWDPTSGRSISRRATP